MKFNEFRESVKNYPFFKSDLFVHLTKDPRILRNQIKQWVEKKYLIVLKRGFYTLNQDDRKRNFSVYLLANNLYLPSYVSLESALSLYNFIPEKVYSTTSVSTKKTQKFSNQYGEFLYHNIKQNLFKYFVKEKDQYGNVFFIASPEKALVDFLYLKLKEIKKFDQDIFSESFRFQNLEKINLKKLINISKEYQNAKLLKLINLLLKFIKDKDND